MEDDQLDGVCSTDLEGMRNARKFQRENKEGRDDFGDLSADGDPKEIV